MPSEEPQVQEWFNSLPAELQSDATLQLHKTNDLPTLAKSFLETKKMVGNSLRIPGEQATPEEWGKVYDQLGYPKDPKDYEIPDPDPKMIPEGYEFKKDEALIQEFSKFAAERRLSKGVAKDLINMFYGIQFNNVKRDNESANAQAEETKTLIKTIWKTDAEYDKGMEMAAKVAETYAPKEIGDQVFDAIKSLPPKSRAALVGTLYNLGKSMKEGTFMTGETSAATAESQLQALEKEENEILADDNYSKHTFGSIAYDPIKHGELQEKLRAVQKKKVLLMMNK